MSTNFGLEVRTTIYSSVISSPQVHSAYLYATNTCSCSKFGCRYNFRYCRFFVLM